MEYKLIIILILLVTIYALYYTKKNTNWIIALSLLLILVINELIKDKDFFQANINLPQYQGLLAMQNTQGSNIRNTSEMLDMIEKVIRNKYSDNQNTRNPAIPINNSCVLT